MEDILRRVGVDAPIEKVDETPTSLGGNRDGWDSNATDAKRGGSTFFKHVDMKVLETAPEELVKWQCTKGPEEWMDTQIFFRLGRKDEQAVVEFSQTGGKHSVELMHHCSPQWVTYLLSLKALLEDGNDRPASEDVQA